MKILQNQVSEVRKSPFFYHGVIAEGKGFKLETYQDGELVYDDGLTMKTYVGAETPKLAKTDCYDADIDAEVIVDIYVDKFFIITKDGVPFDDESMIFTEYDEAILGFKNFLSKV